MGKSLPKVIQMGLKFSACLGPTFDAKVLGRARKNNTCKDSFLTSCVEFGFLQRLCSDQYVWAHDQIQQSAYDLIPLSKREAFHLLVGSRLFITSSPSEMEHMVFFIVDNMNRGSNLLPPDQKYEVSQLNLSAGEKALTASAFHSASKYLLKGLSLLGPGSWDTKYNLTLRLFDAASEALYAIGNFPRLSTLIDEPLSNARTFEDKLNILNNCIRSLSASSQYSEGISKCITILSQLGEVLPVNITADIYRRELAQVKVLLKDKSRQELLSLPLMSNTQKMAAMQFMNHLLIMGYVVNPRMNIITVFRMIKMTLQHGLCNISPFAFACYGALVVNVPISDVEGGYMLGRVAIEMMNTLGAVEMLPRVFASVYGLINIWKEPWQSGLNKHLEAYECATSTGDLEYAVTNLFLFADKELSGCGENLESLLHNIQSYTKRAFQCNQIGTWKSLVILHQLTLDLIGIKLNAFSPFSNSMTEELCFSTARDNNEKAICRLIMYKKKFVSFFAGDMDTAREMYELGKEYPVESGGEELCSYLEILFLKSC